MGGHFSAVRVLILVCALRQGLPIESKLSYTIKVCLVLCGKFYLVVGYSTSPTGLSVQALRPARPAVLCGLEQVNGRLESPAKCSAKRGSGVRVASPGEQPAGAFVSLP